VNRYREVIERMRPFWRVLIEVDNQRDVGREMELTLAEAYAIDMVVTRETPFAIDFQNGSRLAIAAAGTATGMGWDEVIRWRRES